MLSVFTSIPHACVWVHVGDTLWGGGYRSGHGYVFVGVVLCSREPDKKVLDGPGMGYIQTHVRDGRDLGRGV